MRAQRRAARARSRRCLPWLALLLLGLVHLPALPPAALAQAGVDLPVVAVLPFRVHSAKPLDYLGESLADLVRSRLEASGELRVLDAATVSARLGDAAVDEVSGSALRRLAGELGADYLITGSVTELAGHYSLDVRVTPAAIALRSHTRVLTAERDDELLTRVNELADGVIEQVVGAAPAAVVRIELVGAEWLEEELRGRLATRVGEPFDPATLRGDLAMLRSHPAVANASVETERGPEGVVVRFRLVGSERIFVEPTPGQTADLVAEVRVRGNRRIEADAIRARIATRPGGPYRPAQISKDVREIHALGFFRDIRVFSESTREGYIVVFEVEENPVVRQIAISGNESVEADEIRDILTLTTGSTLDYPLLFENRSRIEALYRAQGFYLAQVDHEIEPLTEAAVAIHFLVDENDKLRLRKIDFVGNERFSDAELREDFRTKTWRFWSYATSWFDKSGTYSEPLFLQDLRSVEKMYGDAGYLQVEVGAPEVVADSEGLTVTVPIAEGNCFRVGEIDVAGDTTVDIETLLDKLQLKEGEIFNRTHLTEDVASITEHYTNRGFYFASVTPLSSMSEDDEVVDVVFQVRKGPLYFVRQIDIAGNTRTVDSVIRREIPIVEGQLYSQRAIQLSRSRIQSLRFFEEVDLQMEPTDEPDQLDLEVSVVEKPTGSFSFGAGFSSQDAFVVNGSLSQSNLFGRGYGVNLSADVGKRTQRFYLSFQDPALFGSDFSFGTTLFRTTQNWEDFEQEQTGANFVLGHSLTEDNRTRAHLRYSFASREVLEDPDVNAAAVIFREILSDALTSSLVGLSINSDTRDDRLAPTKGMMLGGSLEFAGLGFFAQFLRAEAQATWYLGAPRWLLDRSTFVLSSRVGYALPLNTISDFDAPGLTDLDLITPAYLAGNADSLQEIDDDLTLPLSERYFLGGLGHFQLRGFKARSVGPRRPILTRNPSTLDPDSGLYRPVGTDPQTGLCDDTPTSPYRGNGNEKCNEIGDKDIDDFEDLDETDVVGGNKFIAASFEYRFPISDTIGLQGVLFFDTGNAFAEGDHLFDVTEWRYGTGGGVQWFSPFGPLAVVLGFPLDRLSVEDSPVFEFSVGGAGF